MLRTSLLSILDINIKPLIAIFLLELFSNGAHAVTRAPAPIRAPAPPPMVLRVEYSGVMRGVNGTPYVTKTQFLSNRTTSVTSEFGSSKLISQSDNYKAYTVTFPNGKSINYGVTFSYKDGIQTAVYRYSDGGVQTLTSKPTTTDISFASDHVTRTTTYAYANGEKSVVVENVNPKYVRNQNSDYWAPNIKRMAEISTTTYGDGYVEKVTALSDYGYNISIGARYSGNKLSSVGKKTFFGGVNQVDLNGSIVSQSFAGLSPEGLTELDSFNKNGPTRDTFLSTNKVTLMSNTSGNHIGLATQAAKLGWSYQSFGAWNNPVTGNINAVTFGSNGIYNNIPTSGSASYRGVAGGIYKDASSTNYFVQSDMAANANFNTKVISISTTNTAVSSGINNAFVANPQLNFTGSMNYQLSNNDLNGTARTASGLSGAISGQFYGPNQNEIGGVFALTNGNASYVGGFGGTK